MATKTHNGTKHPATSGWLPHRDEVFWQRLQVYPNAVSHSETKKDYERRALAQLQKLGHANLLYLANAAGIRYRADADSSKQLAIRLFMSSAKSELVYLATFLRPRVSAVVEYYDGQASALRALELEIDHLSRGAPETPKPFTKLIDIYRKRPDDLEAIHYRYAWRRLPTLFEFTTDQMLTSGAATMLERSVEALITSLNKLRPGETYEFFGRSALQTGPSVFVLHRNYPASVRPDYASAFRLQHDFSTIVFALDEPRRSLLVKVANRGISRAVADWAGTTLDCSFIRAGGSVFADYTPESVEHALLGGYDDSYGIDLTALEFRHSFAPNHSRIALSALPLSKSIREDLRWMHDQGLLRLRSLGDIASLKVRFEGAEAEVTCDIEKEGAIRLRLDDSNIADERTDRLRRAFQDTFGIPLGQRIDPTVLTMGTTEVYQFLLSGVAEEHVLEYQRESLGKLIEWKLLKVIDVQEGHCTDANCTAGRNQTLTDTSLAECPACQGTITWETHRKFEDDAKRILAVVRKLIQRASGWKMASDAKRFESHTFYRLFPKSDPNRTVCVFVNNRLNAAKIDTFQRAMFPILVVHPQGTQRMPIIDPAGIAHFGLPYALSALDDPAVWKNFREGCKDVIQRLLRMEQERILRTSRHSYDNLTHRPAEYDDRKYEADVYNVLRSVFPYTVRWGGQNRPDGFSSLVYFEDNDLSKPSKFNWSYDAKYSDSMYPFKIAEFRQMFDYIRSLYQPKRMKAEGNRYDAHAIITNSMDEGSMKNAADYLWTQHRLGKEHSDFLLLFIRDSFLTRLWQRVREAESAFSKRSTYLPEFLVQAIKEAQSDGFSVLDESVADRVATEILAQPEVQSVLDHEALKADLNRVHKTPARLGLRSRRTKKAH